MVTKEQALTCKTFRYNVYCYRANGKCKTWKTRPNEFKLPIKHGLYIYGYLTHENAHLFEVV